MGILMIYYDIFLHIKSHGPRIVQQAKLVIMSMVVLHEVVFGDTEGNRDRLEDLYLGLMAGLSML